MKFGCVCLQSAVHDAADPTRRCRLRWFIIPRFTLSKCCAVNDWHYNISCHKIPRLVMLMFRVQVWEAIKYCTIDSALALGLAFLINMAVVGTFAVQASHNAYTTMPLTCACSLRLLALVVQVI
jgi:hypothetical protein